MSKSKKEPLYKKISGFVVLIGVVISLLGFLFTCLVGLGYLVPCIVGYMDYATMQAALSRLEDKYSWIFAIVMFSWWPGVCIGFLIDQIGDILSKKLASS